MQSFLHRRPAWLAAAWLVTACFTSALAQVAPPDSLVLGNIPEIPEALRDDVSRYLETRSAAFNDWHPQSREMLITTRFAEAAQLHRVRMPGGARRQLTFLPEPVSAGAFRPQTGAYAVFLQDTGGGEFYQIFRFDFDTGRPVLITDGKSRNSGGAWAESGSQLAYTSTRRNGRDTDIYVMDPANPASDRLVHEVLGGGWQIEDWSPDETRLLIREYVSINKSRIHVLDLKTGRRQLLTPDGPTDIAYANLRFAKDGRSIFALMDQDSEFLRLAEFETGAGDNPPLKLKRVLTSDTRWDVEEFELSKDGSTLAYVVNEGGPGVLHLADARTGQPKRAPELPIGVISGLKWHPNNRDLGFSISSARSPLDAYSANTADGSVERWTESETGGLDPARFVQPELIRVKSFDGLEISAFVYRPDPSRFPGRRPVMLNIHGGPEAQSRPLFLGRNNYLLNELGIALVYPNVRGSSGYGKSFLLLDNGFKREDSVRDIGAIIDWLRQDSAMDPERVGVMGGSYGGYMVLASLIHFGDKLRCGIDVVGISNFLTFLKNTQDYRRDLRRVEYGDERNEEMRRFLEKISPTTNVERIRQPLLVVQGKNDPRVPLSESEQMVKAIRDNGGIVWYLMARDEGHGFAKKKNADFQFLVTIQFLKEHLLE